MWTRSQDEAILSVGDHRILVNGTPDTTVGTIFVIPEGAYEVTGLTSEPPDTVIHVEVPPLNEVFAEMDFETGVENLFRTPAAKLERPASPPSATARAFPDEVPSPPLPISGP
ncbi:MAG TPA: hypothetical protein VFQ88_05965 [Nevskiaceae bacterium]|nr:hypothetical protein [Nevskiaceae bacterium]